MQVYAVIGAPSGSDGNPVNAYAVAKKRVRNAFWQGAVTNLAVVNQAGQLAFPGGGMEGDGLPRDEALREVLEETGMDLGRYPSTDWHDPTGSFVVVLFTMDIADLISFVQDANANLAPDSVHPDRPAGATRGVKDWEIESMSYFPAHILKAEVGRKIELASAADRAAVAARQRQRGGRYSQSIDWYKEIAEMLP